MMRVRLLLRTATMIGPALFVLVLAGLGSSWPLRTALAAARAEESAVVGALPGSEAIAAAEARRGLLREQLRAKSAMRPSPSSPGLGSAVASPFRAAWHRQLTEVLQRHRLTVLGEERGDVDLPSAVARGLFGPGGATRCPAWSLRLTGGYLDVLAALAALRDAPLPSFVLDLDMRRSADGALSWTLVVT